MEAHSSPKSHQPTLTYQTKLLNRNLLLEAASQSVPNITITYDILTSNRRYTTNDMLLINDCPLAITSYQLPDHRHNTDLSVQAHGCLIPLLWCQSELVHPLSMYRVTLKCNTKQLHKQLLEVYVVAYQQKAYM
jgi:hypothetical protein